MGSAAAAAKAERLDARDREWSRLMAAAQAGDQQAYATLLRAILPVIRSIVQREHRAPDRAEDVVQDVLLTLHRVRQTYDPGRPFIHWLAIIARRRSIDRLRRHGRQEAYEVSDDLAYEGFEDLKARHDLEIRDRAEGLGGAIAALPEGQRQAIELLKLQELSLAEASLVTGRSIAALKVNVHRAMKALRQRLSHG